MLQLFTSCVCEHCDTEPQGDFFRGWVVWPEHPVGTVQTWVFRTLEDAQKWMRSRNGGDVRAVLSPEPYTWTRSRGSLKDVILAERPFEVFPDHRFPPGQHRAFLAPPDIPDADRIRLRSRRAG
jgi:hypothetical protein